MKPSLQQVFGIPIALALALPSVAAQSMMGTIGGMFENTLGFLFAGNIYSSNFVFWGKFLVWILVFALLTLAVRKIPGVSERKNVGTAIAATVSLISILAMPASIIHAIFEDYGIVVSFILIATPLIAAVFLIESVFKNPERLHYAIKAIAYYLLGTIITHIGNVSRISFDANFRAIWSFAAGTCFLLFLWNLIRAILGGKDEAGSTGEGGGLGKFWDWLNKPKSPEAERERTDRRERERREKEEKERRDREEKERKEREEPEKGKGTGGIPITPPPAYPKPLATQIDAVNNYLGQHNRKVKQVVSPAGAAPTLCQATLNLYRQWRQNVRTGGNLHDRGRLALNIKNNYRYLAQYAHDINGLFKTITEAGNSIQMHPDFARLSARDKQYYARVMASAASAHRFYADGLMRFYNDMAAVP